MSRPAATDKIQGRHRDRLAVVHVRQSTLQQVGRHPESTRLQYALAERAQQLGWARERIMVIRDGQDGRVAITFNYRDLESGTKLEQDIPLAPGDIIIVP